MTWRTAAAASGCPPCAAWLCRRPYPLVSRTRYHAEEPRPVNPAGFGAARRLAAGAGCLECTVAAYLRKCWLLTRPEHPQRQTEDLPCSAPPLLLYGGAYGREAGPRRRSASRWRELSRRRQWRRSSCRTLQAR